ncbi:hypothetical protein DCCM_0667 [Desulfocucumis palustris]|uniref:Uncharacterized protein n=1 Tax=Desulfocucumis palustris TaxID=1898651 RepID=A0A2L2XF53_9FIRM|nr:hypothetical protein DCCM_0667 [Desulfocucumis palustris]
MRSKHQFPMPGERIISPKEPSRQFHLLRQCPQAGEKLQL